jgi:hypothetical protein
MHALASFLVNGATPCFASLPLTYLLLWGGSLALSVTLVVLLLTRWGHSRPLHKCAVLSLIVHLIMAFLTMTVRIVNGDGGGGGGGGPPIHVRIVDESAVRPAHTVASKAMETPAIETIAEVAAPALLEPPPPKKEEPPPPPEPEKPLPKPLPKPEPAPPIAEAPPKESAKKIVEPNVEKKSTQAVAKTEAPKPIEKPEAPKPSPSPAPSIMAKVDSPPNAATTSAATSVKAESAPTSAAAPAAPVATTLATSTYSLRNQPGRLGLVAGQGGNAETEAAVAAALRWLAANQSKDGRWDAVQFGAGQEEMTLGQNRGGAGRGADTGITALALLAFLGAGHSHVQGEYQDNVRHGLDFLLRSQAADGSLFGDATLYAQMYCHSMATFALAEAQAMTGDRRLAAATTKAINFSLAAQNTTTGGWRYRPGDSGDTSQLGWQVMALASAQRAGIKVPNETWSRVERFLHTVQRGERGGLASYRPDSPVSTSMTAEALYCRLVLQEMSDTNLVEPAAIEATTQLLTAPPSTDRFNLYYWYYATLALHHRQNSNDTAKAAWRTWNDGMTAALTKSQLADGTDAGSWNSNTMWGGYGGRIYTTAMATMCLEVYYRYAPAPPRGGTWSASRPQPQPITR